MIDSVIVVIHIYDFSQGGFFFQSLMSSGCKICFGSKKNTDQLKVFAFKFENNPGQCYNNPTMNDVEKTVLQTCTDLNDNVTVFSTVDRKIDVYKSRFLELNLTEKYIIIDEPSPENKDAGLILKSQDLECFFEYKTFRYLFMARVMEHCDFFLNGQRLHALKLTLPDRLADGERREYFRVEVSPKQPITVRFHIYKEGASIPIMSPILKGKPHLFEGLIHDVSGAGVCIYSKEKSFEQDLEKGDRVELFFSVKPRGEEIHLWADVRNVRRIENLGGHAWGVRFIENRLNPNLKKYRSLLMRYVMERQREILAR